MDKILIIEDDETICFGLKYYLEQEGFKTESTYKVDEILKLLPSINLVLLDINLPNISGFDLFQEIKKVKDVPIIFLTANDLEVSIVRGLDMGADDYITKPFSMGILLAKINAVLRRSTKAEDNILVVKDSKLNLEGMYLKSGDTSIALSKNEFNLLKLFFEKFNKVVSREELLESIWDEDEFIDDNTLTVNITRLKKKIKDNNINLNIETKRGIGYVLN